MFIVRKFKYKSVWNCCCPKNS